MKKAFYFDVETTGLNEWKNDIIQLAWIVEINGEIRDTGVTHVRPFDFTTIEPKALETNGMKLEELKDFPHPQEVHDGLLQLLGKYVNKYDKGDKFHPAGYNVRFDVGFLQNFFKKNNDKYYGSWFNWKLVDPLAKLYEMDYEGRISLPDYKLSTVCAHFGIPLMAHDALSDIKATWELRKHLSTLKF